MPQVIRSSRMHRFLAWAAVLTMAVALAAQAPEWKRYSYPADGFSVALPLDPTTQKNNVPTAAGPFELRAFLAEDGTSALYVGVCHHGAAATNMAADVILAGAKKGALDNVKGRLGTERKITFGIYPGLEFDAVNDMFRFHTRICMVGTTMCQTLTAEPLTQPYAFVNRFLDSFQLIARTQP